MEGRFATGEGGWFLRILFCVVLDFYSSRYHFRSATYFLTAFLNYIELCYRYHKETADTLQFNLRPNTVGRVAPPPQEGEGGGAISRRGAPRGSPMSSQERQRALRDQRAALSGAALRHRAAVAEAQAAEARAGTRWELVLSGGDRQAEGWLPSFTTSHFQKGAAISKNPQFG